jgi:hypothetical protein
MKGFGVFDGNVNGGLAISTNGVITISNLTATSSTNGYGASLNNTGTPLNTDTPKAVSLLGTNNISNNGTDGLVIATFGSVTINNLTASYNGQGGVNGMGANIYNYHVSSVVPANVTLTGANSFVGNHQQGLYITAFGAIKINNLTASDSATSNGAQLLNDNAPSNAYGVTLSGVNNFNGNATDGLYISTKGAVLLNAVTATFNSNNGAYINNTHAGPAAPKPVTLTGKNNFSSNAGGLYIDEPRRCESQQCNRFFQYERSWRVYLQLRSRHSCGCDLYGHQYLQR